MNTPDFDIRGACRAWEQLRLPYNGVLLVLGLLVSLHRREAIDGYWWSVLWFGLAANLAYCLGPLYEVYSYAFLRRQMGRSRYGLFAGGLIFSMAVVCVVAMLSTFDKLFCF